MTIAEPTSPRTSGTDMDSLPSELPAFGMAEAFDGVVVHHTDGLCEGVHDHRSDEVEAAGFQVLRQCFAHRCFDERRFALAAPVHHHSPTNMLPDEIREATGLLLLYVLPGARAIDRCFDLGAAADDTFVLQQSCGIALA